MKKKVGIWLNNDKAVVVKLDEQNESVNVIESDVESKIRFPGETKPGSRQGTNHNDIIKKHEEKKRHQLHSYFHLILENLTDSSDIIIMGPSLAKKDFEKELRKNHNYDHVNIAIENADKMTNKQLIAKVKEHYNKK